MTIRSVVTSKKFIASTLVALASALALAACGGDVNVKVEVQCPRTCVQTGDIAAPQTVPASAPTTTAQAAPVKK